MKTIIGTENRQFKNNIKPVYIIECSDCGKRTYSRDLPSATRRLNKKCYCQSITRHPLYTTWRGMKERCQTHKDYAGRGITVCDEWKDDFWMFVFHMGPKPSPEHSIDRVDNDYIYCPENCRWATKQEQQNNKRTTKP